jgi:hypothetical protein
MMPKQIQEWLDQFYSEAEVRAMIPGTRQNWAKRKARIRRDAGVEIKPGVWLYRRDRVEL